MSARLSALVAAATIAMAGTIVAASAHAGASSSTALRALYPEIRVLGAAANPLALEAIIWRPRTKPRSPEPAAVPGLPATTDPTPVPSESPFEPHATFQLHGGFSQFHENAERGFLGGLRLGMVPEPHLNLGISADWVYRVHHVTAPAEGSPLPGGGVTTRYLELARTTTTRVPVQGYIELTLAPSLFLSPQAGIAGGWHMLFLAAEDQTGNTFDAMYDGWGWQAWAGVTMRFGSSLRLMGEVFRSEANLGRIVEEEDGTRYHEVQDGDDVGARFGLRFGG
jgi:hypothetical protein